MSYLWTALACGIIGFVLLYISIRARKREVDLEGRVMMLVGGVLFLLAAGVNAVVSVFALVL